jgi:hypothetical protein
MIYHHGDTVIFPTLGGAMTRKPWSIFTVLLYAFSAVALAFVIAVATVVTTTAPNDGQDNAPRVVSTQQPEAALTNAPAIR